MTTRNLSKSLVSALALTLLAGGAMAQSRTAIPATWANEQEPVFVSTVSRAQVLAEAQAARESGAVNPFDSLAYLSPAVAPSTAVASVRDGVGALTRQQVRAETDAARRSGEINPFDSLAYINRQEFSSHVAHPVVAQK